MSLQQAKRGFWWVLLAALVSASLTASLGFWQLRRAALKTQIQADIDAQQSLTRVGNADLAQAERLDAWVHRSAELKGEWVPDATVYLDNRQMDGRQGFYVVTPLRLKNDGRWVLVQRGWAPRDFLDRTRVPNVPTPSGEVSVVGKIAAPPARVYELGQAEEGAIRQNLALDDFARAHASTVLQGSLVQLAPVSGAVSDGLLRNWPQVASGVHKHHGYAFQWFGLSALIVVLYVWFQIISPIRRRSEHNPAA